MNNFLSVNCGSGPTEHLLGTKHSQHSSNFDKENKFNLTRKIEVNIFLLDDCLNLFLVAAKKEVRNGTDSDSHHRYLQYSAGCEYL